jgi:uncharacterized membrane protein HdeD (DUF308 family)
MRRWEKILFTIGGVVAIVSGVTVLFLTRARSGGLLYMGLGILKLVIGTISLAVGIFGKQRP